jgi:iron complex outermembrane receptor protein
MRLILLFLLTASFLTARGQADTDTTTTLLQDVLIIENRLQIPFSAASRSIQVIGRDELDIMPAQSVPQALSYVAGVDVRQRGPVGVQADLSIRGSTFEQTLVLLNGIKMSDPQTGHHMLNLPLHLDNIAQIVVLKGPAARAFGQNAFAGAVNIITKVPSQRSLRLGSYFGDFGLWGVSGSLALPSGKYSQYISFNRDASDGYRFNTDFFINNLFYQSEWKMGANTTLHLQGGYNTREFGANGFYASPAAVNQWEAIDTRFASMALEHQAGAWTIKPRAYWRQNNDQYQFVRGRPEIYENIHQTNVLGLELNMSYESKFGTTGIGLENRTEQIASTNLGDWNRNIAGFFIEQHLKWGTRIDLTPGVYVNGYSDFGWNAFPGLDAGYLLGQRMRLYGTVGRSFRIPTYTDLFYEDPANLGNPDLEPERAWTYEAGAKYTVAGLFIQGAYFLRNNNNLIDWVKTTPESQWQPFNFTSMRTSGLEASVQVYPREAGNGRHLVSQLSLSYTYIVNQLDQSEQLISRYVLENLRHQVIAGADWQFLKHFTHTVRFRYLDRVSLENYWLVDTRLNWKRKGYSLFAEATNLFNQAYTEVNLVPMPGRWVRGGFQVQIGF